jgi:hypothetical protein
MRPPRPIKSFLVALGTVVTTKLLSGIARMLSHRALGAASPPTEGRSVIGKPPTADVTEA